MHVASNGSGPTWSSRGRLLGAEPEAAGVRAVPVRRHRVRPRGGHAAGELVARERIQSVGAFSFDGAFSATLPSRRERSHQAWVQISVGCNSVCSYCIVPSVRGRERSRTVPDLLQEIGALAGGGVREVTLLGQNVNSYGRDLRGEERTDFGTLIRAVGRIDGIERLRYTSPHRRT